MRNESQAEPHAKEPPGARAFVLTWVALLVLAAASFALSFVHLGQLALPVALLIALAKAALVVMVFMELIAQPFTNRVVLVTAVAFVVLLAGLVAADVATRAREPLRPLPPSAPAALRP